jgi:hypothetical protein
MEKSEKFGFNLPSRDSDGVADINQISDNFRLVEEKVPSKDDLKNIIDQTYNPQSKNAQSGVAVAEAILKKEDIGNKVTSIMVEPPTHDYYPSAKAVFDKVSDAVGKVAKHFEGELETKADKSQIGEIESEFITIPKIYKGTLLNENLNDGTGNYSIIATKENGLLDAKEGDIYIDTKTYSEFFLRQRVANTLKWNKINYADETFDAESQNAQSGEAVAEAVANKVDKEEGKTLYRGMELIWEHTIDEETFGVVWSSIDKDMNGNKFKLDEIYFFIQAPSSFETQLTANLTITFNKSLSLGYYWFTEVIKSGTRTMQAYGKRVTTKHWFNMAQKISSNLYNGGFYGSYTSSDVDFVTAFKIHGLEQFPIGTSIKICGRRAD